MEEIHLVTATNDNYAKPLGVMLNSLLENKTSDIPINIYIIDGNISSANKRNLNKVVNKFHLTVTFLTVNQSLYRKAAVHGHVSRDAYYRISIPDLLPHSVSKVLYLDCDLIVKEDITKLWNTDINSYFLAAVIDHVGGDQRARELSIPASNYFNSGVMLMNLKKWRSHDISNKLLKFINKFPSKLFLWEQDALNAILHDKWLRLEPNWNYQAYTNKLYFNPYIIHFSSYQKPWIGDSPLKEQYLRYLHTTPWE